MNFKSLFGLIILLHIAGGALLILQPGCQSRPPLAGPAEPSPRAPAPMNVTPVAPSGGITPTRATPTRPAGGSLGAPVGVNEDMNGGLLEPTLDPGTLTPDIAPAAEASPPRNYQIRPGDTLGAIARREGVPLRDLLALNNLTSTSPIFAGDFLLIPSSTSTPEAAPAAPATGATYTVQAGDTLTHIARRYGVTVRELRVLNNLRSDLLQTGQVLQVPANGGTISPAPARSAPSGPTSAPAAGGTTYTVQAGDTAGAIARRFGVGVQDLLNINGITDPRRLRAGDTINIPAGGTQTSRPTAPAAATPAPAPAGDRLREQPTVPQALPDPTAPVPPAPAEDLPFVEIDSIPADSAAP